MTIFSGKEAMGNDGAGVWLVGPKGEGRLMPNILAFSCVHGVSDRDPCAECNAAREAPITPIIVTPQSALHGTNYADTADEDMQPPITPIRSGEDG